MIPAEQEMSMLDSDFHTRFVELSAAAQARAADLSSYRRSHYFGHSLRQSSANFRKISTLLREKADAAHSHFRAFRLSFSPGNEEYFPERLSMIVQSRNQYELNPLPCRLSFRWRLIYSTSSDLPGKPVSPMKSELYYSNSK